MRWRDIVKPGRGGLSSNDRSWWKKLLHVYLYEESVGNFPTLSFSCDCNPLLITSEERDKPRLPVAPQNESVVRKKCPDPRFGRHGRRDGTHTAVHQTELEFHYRSTTEAVSDHNSEIEGLICGIWKYVVTPVTRIDGIIGRNRIEILEIRHDPCLHPWFRREPNRKAKSKHFDGV